MQATARLEIQQEDPQVYLSTLAGFNFTLDDLLCSRKMFSSEADTFTLGTFEV